MSKRKYEDDSHNLEESSSSRRGPNKYSLDSDEEDDEESRDFDVLADEDIEGQEEGATGMEGGIQITPFNMREEMEEGHFDADGMYHWKKEKKVRDNWLENIDWEKIHECDKSSVVDLEDDDSTNQSGSSPSVSSFDCIAAYRQMLEFMKPKESVAKTLRRLGGNKEVSSSDRWKMKKAGVSTLTDEEKDAKVKFGRLTELADSILRFSGNMDIYQETYEYICNKISAAEKKQSNKRARRESEELDMYADDFGAKEQERLKNTENATSEKVETKEPDDNNDTMWEFKLSKESDEIKGPYSSQRMQEIVSGEDFQGEVWVRKIGSSGEFYSSRRIDFELYL